MSGVDGGTENADGTAPSTGKPRKRPEPRKVPNIISLPNGRYRARLYNGRAFLTSKTFNRQGDAKSWLDGQQRQLKAGQFIEPELSRRSLRDIVKLFNSEREVGVRPHTWQTDEANLRLHLPEVMKRRSMPSITGAQLETVYAHMLRSGSARGTVARARNSFGSLWAWAKRNGYIAVNVVEDSVVPRGVGKPKSKINPFSDDELRGLLADIAHKPDYASAVEFSSLTGLRWGELRELRVADLSRHHGMTYANVSRSRSDGFEVTAPKSGKTREIPLSPRAIEIGEGAAKGKKSWDLLFTAPAGGAMLESNLKRAVDWTNVSRGHRWHDLRHFAATKWVHVGVDIKTVSLWLGHSNSAITHQLYVGAVGPDGDRRGLKLIALFDDELEEKQNPDERDTT